ncbi:MAG: Tad domain-containing protein [Anaerolineales bacterium]|nr:Tad domain-containing protein [Anaerolineales bacterium]
MKLPFSKLRTADRGQAILIIALAMVGLVAFVGMMTDGGVVFIEYGKLKRGIDAAAIASAQQFRAGFAGADLAEAAQNFLILNESAADSIIVYRCKDDISGTDDDLTAPDGTVHDPDLCTEPKRKLVRVYAERWVEFGFLRVVGLDGMNIEADSVGEAASIDLVLVIDTSSSMSYQTGGDPNKPDSALDDPSVCNYSATDPCLPLDDVKTVADDFMDTMFFPYDRVSVVAFTQQEDYDNDGIITRDHVTVLPLSADESAVRAAIASLNVFEPPPCNLPDAPAQASPAAGLCLNYDSVTGAFKGTECPLYRNGADLIHASGDEVNDPSSCNSSNIGGALLRAASEFTRNPSRPDAFWVVIMLAGGPANATDSTDDFIFGYCPTTTWNSLTNPFCRDADNDTRHGDGNTEYDADDYARDMGDFVADPVDGQGVSIFTIGLGNLIRNAPKGDPDSAEVLLTYIAQNAGDDEDNNGDGKPDDYTANHGFYSYADNTLNLPAIFKSIANNIFTRIAK